MEYKVEMEKLTDIQLEAFRVINNVAVEMELERRIKESTYTDEKEFMKDVSKAYFFLRSMYDNMRNNDTKKTITNSGVIEMLEKFIRTAKAENIEYEKYAPTVTETEPEPMAEKPVVEKPEPIPQPEPFTGPYKPSVQPEPEPFTGPYKPSVQPESEPFTGPYKPIPMPLRPVLQPEPIPQPKPEPIPQPVAQPQTTISQEKLNEILANIPVVGDPK